MIKIMRPPQTIKTKPYIEKVINGMGQTIGSTWILFKVEHGELFKTLKLDGEIAVASLWKPGCQRVIGVLEYPFGMVL